jgi:predicted tellurium resistance membrane protein TerC
MIDWLQLNLVALVNVIIIDVVLAGDNAIIVGLAASRVAPEVRARVIFWGMAGAVILRIAFAAVTVQLLAIVGLTLAGGILLLWVCWKMYRELRKPHAAHGDVTGNGWRSRP